MKTMYEMIMDFPLFKGIGRNRVSALLERHRILFQNFERGDVISKAGERCESISFIVKGQAKVSRISDDGHVAMAYILDAGAVIGADSMFGWDTNYAETVVANTELSVLTYNKEQYLQLLASDNIYLINYLNYLSKHLQSSREGVSNYGGGDTLSLIARWVFAMTDQYSQDIEISISDAVVEGQRKIRAALAERVILLNGGKFSIPNRRYFLDFMERLDDAGGRNF